MRKMMTKEVAYTIVKAAKMEIENGLPKAVQLPEEKILGNVSKAKAEKDFKKTYGNDVMVYEVETVIAVYEMEVEEFIKHATLKEVNNK